MHGDFFARVAEIKTVSRAVYLASQKEFGLTAARLRTTLTSHIPSSLHFGIIARGGHGGKTTRKRNSENTAKGNTETIRGRAKGRFWASGRKHGTWGILEFVLYYIRFDLQGGGDFPPLRPRMMPCVTQF